MHVLSVSTVALLAALASGGSTASPPATAGRTASDAHFSLVLERTARGWRAQCDRGCRWTKLSMACLGCVVRINAAGVGPAWRAETDTAGFAFTIKRTRAGWAAKGIRGLRWRTLDWTCTAGACRARIDETGVSGA
jgi:hypothetical protein